MRARAGERANGLAGYAGLAGKASAGWAGGQKSLGWAAGGPGGLLRSALLFLFVQTEIETEKAQGKRRGVGV